MPAVTAELFRPVSEFMSKSLITPFLMAAVLTASTFAADKPDLKDPKQRASYCVGSDIGSSLKRQDLDLDSAALSAGLADALAGKMALTDPEIRDTLSEFKNSLSSKMEARAKLAGAENLKKGAEYLAGNGKKDGVKTTASGLQYKVIKSGTGKSPTSMDTVKVHYHGTLTDGTVFDSSVERGEPVTFPVSGVIPGWTEALQLMKTGDKWQLAIPPALAYGEQGPGGKIGPNCTLLFDVELLGIEKAN